jgi:hypothetical protein
MNFASVLPFLRKWYILEIAALAVLKGLSLIPFVAHVIAHAHWGWRLVVVASASIPLYLVNKKFNGERKDSGWPQVFGITMCYFIVSTIASVDVSGYGPFVDTGIIAVFVTWFYVY